MQYTDGRKFQFPVIIFAIKSVHKNTLPYSLLNCPAFFHEQIVDEFPSEKEIVQSSYFGHTP